MNCNKSLKKSLVNYCDKGNINSTYLFEKKVINNWCWLGLLILLTRQLHQKLLLCLSTEFLILLHKIILNCFKCLVYQELFVLVYFVIFLKILKISNYDKFQQLKNYDIKNSF